MDELFTAMQNCPLDTVLTVDSCVEGATKPSLSEDIYLRKHQATIEARLEKLEECCMRPLGNQTTRERLQPLRFLHGSSRKADDPLAFAFEKLQFQPSPNWVWDKLDIYDLDDIEITY
ncbi:hypothetical protein T03_3274 [Trichinella britovi]|uniref:Uncharacterized protein n=1 Tax=Trichinella britovi TaxID=45882 RepID=A0A0V1AMU9_TRIBR|nr:hypothetical protein T03_3274 [Trichinella britovi]